MYDVATPLVVGPLLSTFRNPICHHQVQHHLSWSSSSILSLHFPFDNSTVLSSECLLSMCPIHFLCLFLIVGLCIISLSSPMSVSTYSFVIIFCPTDFLRSSPYPHFESPQSFYIFFSHGPCL